MCTHMPVDASAVDELPVPGSVLATDPAGFGAPVNPRYPGSSPDHKTGLVGGGLRGQFAVLALPVVQFGDPGGDQAGEHDPADEHAGARAWERADDSGGAGGVA